MKRIFIKLLIGVMGILLLAGCTKDTQEEKIEELITKMISCNTYQNAEKNKDQIPSEFEQYFSEDGYKQFITSQMSYIYPEFHRMSKAKDTTAIKIKQVSKIKLKDRTKFKYNLEYIVLVKNEKVKMKDQITIQVSRKNQVIEILILNTSDVMHKLFLDVRVM
ncbi:MAG: hypothetical protein K0S71_150 [Clostridia bacterium]|jgi:hypothetical protein|nr:hypothetical protein [Clostridia bacterium]